VGGSTVAGGTAASTGGTTSAAAGTTSTAAGNSSTGGATSAAAGNSSTGGKATAGGAGGSTSTAVGGSTVAAGGSTVTAGGSGTGGATSTTTDPLDDLIGAICDWEFNCCTTGEAKWELGPQITTSAACKTKFMYELHTDNSAASPYPASYSPATTGLLISLGYQVDLTKVTENPTGIAQCIAQWKAKSCNAAVDPKAAPTHCAATTAGVVDPCSLSNLLSPKLKAGDICTFALTEGAYNDVECVAGTTCLDSTNPDNPNKVYPTCVTRGVATAPCTLDKDCDYNFYCSTGGLCTAKGAPGDTCTYKTPATPVLGQVDAQCQPGLTCNPLLGTGIGTASATGKCVANCTAGYVCNSSAADTGNDFICPVGSSCVPVTVGNDSTSFKVCSTIGATAGAKCNTLEDCGAGLYCAGTSCATRQGSAQACSATIPGNCEAGMFCKSGACATYVGNGLACTQPSTGVADPECDPTTAIGCVYKWDTTLAVPAVTYICSNALLPVDQRCGNDFDCASGLCEFATLAATYKTCISGAAAGISCDANLTAGQYTRCAAGLNCKAGQCVAWVGPGGSCATTTTPATADSTVCGGGTCDATVWTQVDSSDIMCTDVPVPVANGGTGVVCDGK
jgi:hypothetical protein